MSHRSLVAASHASRPRRGRHARSLCLLLALVEGGGVRPVFGSVAGFVLGALVNYALNRRLVFRSDRAHVEALRASSPWPASASCGTRC